LKGRCDVNWLSVSNPVAWWWVCLVSVSAVNVVALVVTARRSRGRLAGAASADQRRLGWVTVLSGAYVLGCGFRSVLPRADVQRICLWDTWWSNVFVGRSVATVAELSFVVEGALVLFFVATTLGSRFGRGVAMLIVGLITTAECFSWYAVLTTNYLGNTVEESLWTTSYALVGVAVLVASFKAKGTLRLALRVAAVGCVAYVAFMISTDVSMYLGRFLEDQRNARAYFTISEGVNDLLTRWVVTHDLEDWRTEIPWMSLYFSFAVWVSIALVTAPMTVAQVEALQRGPTSA
jgi:hypothetical protein